MPALCHTVISSPHTLAIPLTFPRKDPVDAHADTVIMGPKCYAGIIYMKPSHCADIIEAKSLRIGSHNIFVKAKEVSSHL